MKYRHILSDPVVARDDFRCRYCGVDLLSDLERFITLVRDHLVPKSVGGANHHDNRVCACAACDRLKGHIVVSGVEEARMIIAAKRDHRCKWFEQIQRATRRRCAILMFPTKNGQFSWIVKVAEL